MNERLILMGVIGKPHGVHGLMRVNCFSEDPQSLTEYKLTGRTGAKFSLEWVHGDVAQLSEIMPAGPRKIIDRNEAERLTNTELFASRSALPETNEEEFYLADLIGLIAQNTGGEKIGTVAAVHDYGGGTSLEISPGSLLVPFTRAAVPVVDIAAGHVVINPPVEMVAVP